VTTSGGYNAPTLSARAIERALIVRALEEEVPLDRIRVQRQSRRNGGDDRPVRGDRTLGRAKIARVKEASDAED
jgi:hypothetical protein